MGRLIGRGTGRIAIGMALIGPGLCAGLVASSTVLAAPDPLAQSSSVVLQLRNSDGLKLQPKTLSVPVNRGELDPITGAGTIETNRTFRARRRGRKTKVRIIRLTFGASGGSGRIDAKVGKRKVNAFGTLSGGTLARDGWGAKLDGVTARLGKKGARALNRALSGRRRGKASSAAREIKAGLPLGSLAVGAVPREVEVLPGGTLVFAANPLFAVTLAHHCVNATLHLLDPSHPVAIEPIPPATEPALGEFVFPVTGGSIAPDLSSGRVMSAGGQKLTKNDDGTLTPFAGCASGPPIGTSVTQSAWEAEFDLRALATETVLPDGPIGLGALGPFDLAGAATSANPTTKQVTIAGAPVTMDLLSAVVFNSVFPRGSADPNQDFKAGAVLGTLSLSVTTH